MPDLSAFDLKVLDAAECRTIHGIAFAIGRDVRGELTERVNLSVTKLRRADLLAMVGDSYPEEYVTTDAGLRAIGESLR